MKDNKAILVGITSGDINGIGPEVSLKTLQEGLITQGKIIPILYHYPKVFLHQKKTLKIDDFRFHTIQTPEQARAKVVNYIDVDVQNHKVEFGKNTVLGAQLAFRSFEVAARDLQAEKIDVLVTAPLGKNMEDPNFIGHTEYLGELFNVTPLMMMVSENMRLALATTHLPLAQVTQEITTELLEKKINIFYQSLKKDFGILNPKIAVLGLNPHAGEDGKLGTEDSEIIAPLVQKMFEKEQKLIFGPFAADGFFGYGNFKHFDGIFAMYHDQGLIPFKLLSEGLGVNFTAGLPVVRTSPIHGTAHNIAGKGIADHRSMRMAIEYGAKIFEQRKDYLELKANALGFYQKNEKERNS